MLLMSQILPELSETDFVLVCFVCGDLFSKVCVYVSGAHVILYGVIIFLCIYLFFFFFYRFLVVWLVCLSKKF